ncbi:preprotein translocase subunit SecD [Catenuloplanes nepalensis]|uniref:Protein translocase subunit SecD n=1 Tax=Catenuloplanes nepalensis TaxID=587533 RepID=A0ABT9MXW1_9ACTN|nr:protein translocase subunit SecD [Catenuloplanes nepalensis]MDP9796284.1 preprotein translocase subunit SecD [Catenuloplanes nepalensis]
MAPPQGQMRPGRQLAVLGLIFVVLFLMVFFVGVPGKSSFAERLEPKLGLDLIGGTRVTYSATTMDGSDPPAEQLEEARQIIESRVNALGVSEAEVVIEGNRNIVISLAGENRDDLKQVGDAAQLRFRKVLKAADGSGVAPAATETPTATPSPGASASPGAGGSPAASQSPGAAVTSSPSAGGGTGGQGGGAPVPATPTPSGAASATPTPAASGSAAPAPVSTDVAAIRAAVQKKVGEAAWAAASGLQGVADLTTDPTLATTLLPFSTLDPETEVRALEPAMQFNVPQISCAMLDARPAGSIVDEKSQAVACEAGAKYLLDVAKVLGTDVEGASGVLDQQTGDWVVSLDFTGEGQEKWTALTREAYNNEGGTCDQTALGDGSRCRVAVVLDNEVISSPEIQAVLTGDSQITGSFNSASANELASKLRYGALPLTFEADEAQNVSATLGAEQLRAGLLAAGLGMLLVAIYAFFYYRLLGTVIFLSLILSALLTYGALVVLGRQIGFTLTLAGIAGFIVSLGVAADSFIIYFERLKDEIREGRSPRSAVGRAWTRARRTIISANAISLMAAVVLYIVSVGQVKGFAFALGLATLLDLIVVFLFRHPVMTMFARTRAFLSPRVSGLGRVLKEKPVATDTVKPRSSRVKEA